MPNSFIHRKFNQEPCKKIFEANQNLPNNAPHPNSTWTPHVFGFFKLNVNAAFNANNNSSTSSAVLRGQDRDVIFSARMNHKDTFSPLQAELKAILFGLQTVCNENYRAQFVESDSLLAINEIKKGSKSSIEWLNLILDIDYYSAPCGVHDFIFVNR